ncbi:MAG: glycosyltransferase family 4 protein [Pseudooceanicola nanhaiensis]
MQKFARLLRRLRGRKGHVEGYRDGELYGWAAIAGAPPPNHLTIGVFTPRGMLTKGVANVYRSDLEAAGIGAGDHAFFIPLTPAMRRSIARQGGEVVLKSLGRQGYEIGRLRLPEEAFAGLGDGEAAPEMPAGPAEATGDAFQTLLFGDLEALRDLAGAARKRPPARRQPPFRPHAKMFATRDYLNGGTLPAPLSAYAEYVRYRYKLDKPFPVQEDPAEIAHFLNWYVAGYGPLRKGLRVPMSAEMIDWLNAPMVIGGQRQSLSQVTWSFLMGVPPILHSMDFRNPDWVLWAVYWWSIDQAKALHCEDCLVPQAYVDMLAEVPETWADRPWPLSHFMLRLQAQTGVLSDLDMTREEDRRRLTLAILAMSAQRPDYLRYLPEGTLAALLDDTEDGRNAFTRFLDTLDPDPGRGPIDRALLSDMLRLRGFDLETRDFLTRTEEGHRFEAAILPPVETDEVADIQLIGPIRKASGLGQATRLSASILAETPYSVNPVDFGLDNPAPEGFSTAGEVSDWKRARVNLIHLNAESIPLVYSYAPDVFSDAYNIGYFYWELDTPAACHYLGMDLLDEIWVSTEYGVRIYGGRNDGRPVVNVGMCFEDLPEIPRAEARDFVRERFGYGEREFVFLAAFDSFSFVQRKNPDGVVRAFLEAFPDDPDVRLVIKTQNRTKITDPAQQKVWDRLEAMMEGETRIDVLDETLTYDDLLRLKKGCDCYISLHKSEGWGFGMIEAMNLRVPVVATAYSGNMDFCSEDTAWLVDYEEVELEDDDYIFVVPGQKWARPDHDDAVAKLRAVRQDDAGRVEKVEAAWRNVRENFSAPAIARRYRARLEGILEERSEARR